LKAKGKYTKNTTLNDDKENHSPFKYEFETDYNDEFEFDDDDVNLDDFLPYDAWDYMARFRKKVWDELQAQLSHHRNIGIYQMLLYI
jgi:hypothetical protein